MTNKSMGTIKNPPASFAEFREAFKYAEQLLLSKTEKLERLSNDKTVVLFGYGTRGQSLAVQLRAIGVNAVIYDSNPAARIKASTAGYETTSAPEAKLPLIISAAQNQIQLLRQFPQAYSLVECQYSYKLTNQCAPATNFTSDIKKHYDAAYSVYELLDQASKLSFLQLLLFRSSLHVFAIEETRLPLTRMWELPLQHMEIRSFCDAGAYDGDTIEFLSKRIKLDEVLAIEPNPKLAPRIRDIAIKYNINLQYFEGGLWSHKCTLRAIELLGGMVAVEEDPHGDIAAESLDSIANQDFDYVKFDIEGSEEHAILGATKVLANAKAIAMASYHQPDDIFKLPLKMVDLRANSKNKPNQQSALHFRHYSECFDDSIFYYF